MNVHVIGRPGSDYRKKVDEWLGNVPLERAQCVLNYGLQGESLNAYVNRHPRITDLPNLNMYQFGNKYECVKAVLEAGMSAPESWKWRDRERCNNYDNLIIKPYYSLGGRGISRIGNFDAVSPEEQRTHYLQEEITNRRYELRCLAASWIKPKDWLFMKRVHDEGEAQLAWNHHNGGRFVTVNDPSDPLFGRVRDDVEKMLPLLGYQFGAVDFIIQNNPGGRLKHFFIEWNLAPGWSIPNTEAWMHNLCIELKKQPLENIECYENGMLIADVSNEHDPLNIDNIARDRINRYIRDLEEIGNPYADLDARQDAMMWEAQYDIVNDYNYYEACGAVLMDNDRTRDFVTEEGFGDHYISLTCPSGDRILVAKGRYTCYCPVCGRQIEVRE